MSEIHLQSADAENAAAAVNQQAADTTADLQALRARLAPLADAFRGQAARAFDARIEEWQTSANQLVEALDQLGNFLRHASEQITATDEAIAGQLAG